ncbi:MAG: hypothetical protein ACJAVK_000661 [Akkermansiaceae bacterium]|jgi:hypothetical protein
MSFPKLIKDGVREFPAQEAVEVPVGLAMGSGGDFESVDICSNLRGKFL